MTNKQPTYTALQIKEMTKTVCDYEAMKILSELISEEIDLYDTIDMEIITQASMILFSRSLLMKFLKP